MKHLLGLLAAALLGPSVCFAEPGDAESEKRRQEMEAKRQAAEAAQRAEAERERQTPRLQHPILRSPDPGELGRNTAPTTSPERRASATRMFADATELERNGKGAEAIKLYERAARGGNGKAAARLGDIYSTGIPGVERDDAQSLRWYNAARAMGEGVPAKKP